MLPVPSGQLPTYRSAASSAHTIRYGAGDSGFASSFGKQPARPSAGRSSRRAQGHSSASSRRHSADTAVWPTARSMDSQKRLIGWLIGCGGWGRDEAAKTEPVVDQRALVLVRVAGDVGRDECQAARLPFAEYEHLERRHL